MSLLPHPATCGEVWDSPCGIFVQNAKFVNFRRSSGQYPLLLPLLEGHEESFRIIVKGTSTLGSRGEKAVCHMEARELTMKKRCIYFFLLKSFYNVLIQ